MKWLAGILLLLFVSGCTQTQRVVLPEELAETATVAGFDARTIRVFGDANEAETSRLDFSRIPDLLVERSRSGRVLSQNFLVLSGGGANGAYSAGLLHGWTKTGTRPKFTIVTGVSTGALIAPFAFLGSEYDPFLKEFYTEFSTKDLVQARIFSGLAGGPALTSAKPLEKLIERFITPDVLRKIAKEYLTGRILLMGTTNLDLQRPVIWNMGAIAAKGDEAALELFRKVIRASISIPAVFEPVLIDVVSSGLTGHELHVDGGTTDNAILVPLSLNLSLANTNKRPKRKLYIVVNFNLEPQTDFVEIKALEVAMRSLNTLLNQQALSDVQHLYEYARRNGIQFNFTQIPKTFDKKSKEAFDVEYMRALFQLGEDRALAGYPWQRRPGFIE